MKLNEITIKKGSVSSIKNIKEVNETIIRQRNGNITGDLGGRRTHGTIRGCR